MANPKAILSQIGRITLLVVFTFTPIIMFIGQTPTIDTTDAQEISPIEQTIKFWHPYTDERQIALESLVEDFNATNEWDITVEGVSFRNTGLLYDQMILQLIAVNNNTGNNENLPNLLIGFPHEIALYRLTEDTIVDLNSFNDDTEWGFWEVDNTDFVPSIMNIGFDPFSQQQLGLPTRVFTEVMMVNLDALHELGYDEPPSSHAELVEMACAFSEMGGWSDGKFGTVQGFLLPLEAEFLIGMNVANSGQIFDANPTPTFTFDSPSLQEALSMLVDLQQDNCSGIVQSSVDAIEAFAAGQTLFYFGSTSTLGLVHDHIALSYATPFEWGIFPLPGNASDQIYIFGPMMSIVNHLPEANLAAWLFLKWFLSTEPQAIWVEATGSLPIRQSTLENTENSFENFPQWNQAQALIVNQSTIITTLPALAGYDVIRLEIQFALQRILTGANTIDAELTALDRLTNEILFEFADLDVDD